MYGRRFILFFRSWALLYEKPGISKRLAFSLLSRPHKRKQFNTRRNISRPLVPDTKNQQAFRIHSPVHHKCIPLSGRNYIDNLGYSRDTPTVVKFQDGVLRYKIGTHTTGQPIAWIVCIYRSHADCSYIMPYEHCVYVLYEHQLFECAVCIPTASIYRTYTVGLYALYAYHKFVCAVCTPITLLVFAVWIPSVFSRCMITTVFFHTRHGRTD